MHAAVDTAGEIPDQPRVDITEKEFPFLCALACAGNLIQNPLDFRSRKIRGDQKPRMILDLALPRLILLPSGGALPLRAKILRAHALPDNGVIDRFSR